MISRFFRAYYMELSIYTLLVLAAFIMFLAPLTRVEAGALSLKDPPGYAPPRARKPAPRLKAAFPPSKTVPAAPARPTTPVVGIAERWKMLSTCISYFVIARMVHINVDPEVAQRYRDQAIALLKELQKLPPPTEPEKESIFLSVFEEYTASFEGRTEETEGEPDLYHKYEAVCSAVARPLLQ